MLLRRTAFQREDVRPETVLANLGERVPAFHDFGLIAELLEVVQAAGGRAHPVTAFIGFGMPSALARPIRLPA